MDLIVTYAITGDDDDAEHLPFIREEAVWYATLLTEHLHDYGIDIDISVSTAGAGETPAGETWEALDRILTAALSAKPPARPASRPHTPRSGPAGREL